MTLDEVRVLDPWDRIVYFTTEREAIRLKKESGLPPPWSDDELLQRYRFTNVRRMDDKVSRWLLSNWYTPYFDHPNMLYAVALARFINLPSSLNQLTHVVFDGGVFDKRPDWTSIKQILRALTKYGPIFNGAYMVRGNDGVDKVASVVDHYVNSLVVSLPEIDRASMEITHSRITPLYGFGSFMAGQVVADLRWALSGSWDDKMTWAPRGPGSSRGINRLYGLDPKTPMKDSLFRERMTEVIETLRAVLPEAISGRLEAQDYQSVMCESDKYNRVLFGEGKPKQLYNGGK